MNSTIWNGLRDYISPVSEDVCNAFYKNSKQIYNCTNIETRQWVHLERMGSGVLAIAFIAACGLGIIYLNKLNRNARLVQVMHLVLNDFGEVRKIQQLIKEGRDLDSRVFKNGRTHLHKAAAKGYGLVADDLLKAGASIDLVDERGQTALHRACQKGEVKIAESLIEKGASKLVRDHEGRTPVMLLMESGYDGEIDFLIEGNLNDLSKAGFAPLHLAASIGKLSWIQSLLSAGADANLPDVRGRKAIVRLLEDQLPLNKFEKQYFADCSDAERKENSEKLRGAFARLNPDLQLKIKKAMLNIAKNVSPGNQKNAVASALKDPYFTVNGFYLMGMALIKVFFSRIDRIDGIVHRPEEIVPCAELLLSKTDHWNAAFLVLLERQYRRGDGEDQNARKVLLEKLLNSPKVNPNQPGPISPFAIALRNSGAKFEIVKMLLKTGKIDLESPIDLHGNTVAHVAAEVGAFEVLEEIVKKGINTLTPNHAGVLPLQKALEARHESCMRLLLNQMDRDHLQKYSIDGLTLVEYALVHAPRGLREALNVKGIFTTKDNCNMQLLDNALMGVFLKDLKAFIAQSGFNFKELNTLVKELDEGAEPESPSLYYQKLKLGIRHYLDVVLLEGEYQMREPHYTGSEMMPMPFGDYFSLRRGVGEIANFDFIHSGLQQIFDKLPKEVGKFFRQEQSLSSFGAVYKAVAPPNKMPPCMAQNFRNKVEEEYKKFEGDRLTRAR